MADAASSRAFRVAYDGRPFRGFQRQPAASTVEGTLFDALEALGVAEGPPEGYAAAGRTDAGVSALAQTVAFECPDWCRPAALNAELPAAIRAWAAADVDPDFHATHDATERTYRYHLHVPGASLERARGVLDRVSGEHDFHNLTPAADGTVRTLRADARRDGEFLIISASAGGFPREFVRRLATLVERVATGRADLAFVDRILDPEPLSGPEGIGPAPAPPLVLSAVEYPDARFAIDREAAASARAAFEDRRVEGLTTARVAGAVADGVDPSASG